jgi:hypothetical protein
MTHGKNPAERRTVEIWKSPTHDSQIPTAPAAAVLWPTQNYDRAKSVTHVPGLMCYLCPGPLTTLVFEVGGFS